MSIGLPVYNGARFLPATIDALLSQDYGDFELVISDNASTDATEEICRAYAARDARVAYHRNRENLGAAGNYNLAFRRTRGRYFKWAAADDLHDPRYLGTLVAALDAAPPRVVLVYPRAWLIDEHGEVLGPYDDRLDLRAPDPCARLRRFARVWNLGNPCFGLARRAALDRTGLIRPFVSSDLVLLAELALLGELHELPERLFLRRMHGATSRQAHTSRAAIAAWFDPRAPVNLLAPRTKIFVEVLRLVASAGQLSGAQRARCWAAFTAAWAVRRTRVRLGALRRGLASQRPAGSLPAGR